MQTVMRAKEERLWYGHDEEGREDYVGGKVVRVEGRDKGREQW